VEQLSGQLITKSHNVLYVDRLYTGVPFVEELAEANITLVGTIMKSEKGLTKALNEPEIEKGKEVLYYEQKVLVL